MQFSKLRLTGFKSFVDPTELLIQDGLTGVVGPNGCGKSNLLEALRWVMGENRPTAMRGGGMEDVIFAGAASRPARSTAEVALLIDNSDRVAPPSFNDSDILEVVRRITKDAGSAYRANGKEARARDVQMLFADASTGSHSPALVRQGQISELINAKPRARRRILEEAAGISGLYQRRHEAELKLKATTANLERVEDVVTQLDGRLSSLARQARQAARYREIAAELRKAEGLLLYRKWQEARDAAAEADQALTAATRAAAEAQGAAQRHAADRAEAAEALPPLREEEAVAGAVLQRLTVERDGLKDRAHRTQRAIERLQETIATLGQDLEREAALNRDAGETISRLEWEGRAIAEAREGEEVAQETADEAARAAGAKLRAAEEALDRLAEDAARLKARAQAAQRREAEARGAQAKVAAALEQLHADAAALDGQLADARASQASAAEGLSAAEAVSAESEARLTETEATRAAAQLQEAETRSALSAAQAEAKALAAEVDALERLLSRDATGEAQLLDQVRVAPGFEAALGAALGDDLRAPESDDGARSWAGGVSGVGAALPEGAQSIAEHVTAPKVLGPRLAMIGVVAAEDGPRLAKLLKAGQRLVSRGGDMWRWDGFRVAGGETSATALRLEQQNRLDALAAQLDEAQRAVTEAEAAQVAAADALKAAAEEDASARDARRAAEAALSQARRALSDADAELSMRTGRRETVENAIARRLEDQTDAEAALAEALALSADLGDPEAADAAVEAQRTVVGDVRGAMLSARSAADALRREAEARIKRQQELTKELSGWRHRLATAKKRAEEVEARRAKSEEDLKSAQAAPAEIAAQRDKVEAEMERAESRRKSAADAVALAETRLRGAEETERQAERTASDAREARARAEAKAEATAAHLQESAGRIQEELECAPEAVLETFESTPDDVPPALRLEEEIITLRRQRDALGAVNLRAEEDAREVQEERDALATEIADLAGAVEALKKGIAALNSEGRERLLTAFEEVNRNFAELFTHLFGGGEAQLELIESDDPLEAGLEIMCQPPGKKLSTLSLLSGGEQTLTALSLIFAVFRANPSPICVLDEVDAPLDDANVGRFCDLLDEMTRQTRTRFLIITHHAVTMSRMDRLFGVTMVEQGVSQLVSVDLNRAEAMVANG
ncbi:MAG: chromosome segregation protein SMC [Pseudomonadota bacterium]